MAMNARDRGRRARPSQFGRLLRTYRQLRGYRLSEFSRALGNRWSPETIGKYELQRRDPSPAFIAAAVDVLGLSREQQAALLRAHLADWNTRFLQEYLAAARVYDRSTDDSSDSDAPS